MTAAMLLLFTACSAAGNATQNAEPAAQAAGAGETAVEPAAQAAEQTAQATAQSTDTAAQPASAQATSAAAAEDLAPAEKNGDIMILYTSDIHCGADQGFGLVGLKQVRDTFEAQGYTTILVDDGDAVQGELMGTVTKGEAMIKLMNEMKYDVVIPGNHEFDYGMEQFNKLVEMADFPYISCNLTKEGELVFEPYIIKEAAGKRIAFVGVTTPETLSSSMPSNFKNEDGEFIYDFMNDASGEKLYAAVQKAVDDARAEGVDYVYLLGHLGIDESSQPWDYADVISHTNGIDVMLDGHSHDTEQVTMKNKDGETVVRSAAWSEKNMQPPTDRRGLPFSNEISKGFCREWTE